jgi:hypothetical protein
MNGVPDGRCPEMGRQKRGSWGAGHAVTARLMGHRVGHPPQPAPHPNQLTLFGGHGSVRDLCLGNRQFLPLSGGHPSTRIRRSMGILRRNARGWLGLERGKGGKGSAGRCLPVDIRRPPASPAASSRALRSPGSSCPPNDASGRRIAKPLPAPSSLGSFR